MRLKRETQRKEEMNTVELCIRRSAEPTPGLPGFCYSTIAHQRITSSKQNVDVNPKNLTGHAESTQELPDQKLHYGVGC